MFIRANLFDKIVGHSNVWSKYIYVGDVNDGWREKKKFKITWGWASWSPWKNVPVNIDTVT